VTQYCNTGYVKHEDHPDGNMLKHVVYRKIINTTIIVLWVGNKYHHMIREHCRHRDIVYCSGQMWPLFPKDTQSKLTKCSGNNKNFLWYQLYLTSYAIWLLYTLHHISVNIAVLCRKLQPCDETKNNK